MVVRPRRARLGARLPRPCVKPDTRILCAAFVAALVLLQPAATLAKNDAAVTESAGGTVHVRATDGNTADDAGGDAAVYSVAARDVPAAKPTPESPPPPSAGEVIVGFALQYVGYPYVWAGNTPAGFDCSGFTEFVILNTLGIDIGHGLEGQPGAGAWVDYGAWLPGDLVFFQNTYKAGLSHVGIYIGDGLFVHAENEGTGVVISNIYSDYYGPRYWGAVRVV
jgi:cell wall-associated NlpC family hydrolase